MRRAAFRHNASEYNFHFLLLYFICAVRNRLVVAGYNYAMSVKCEAQDMSSYAVLSEFHLGASSHTTWRMQKHSCGAILCLSFVTSIKRIKRFCSIKPAIRGVVLRIRSLPQSKLAYQLNQRFQKHKSSYELNLLQNPVKSRHVFQSNELNPRCFFPFLKAHSVFVFQH